jgi:hypothetical protein
MKQAPRFTKAQRELLDWIWRRGPILKMTIILDGRTRAMNTLLEAGYIEGCEHPEVIAHPEAGAPAVRITDKGKRVAMKLIGGG